MWYLNQGHALNTPTHSLKVKESNRRVVAQGMGGMRLLHGGDGLAEPIDVLLNGKRVAQSLPYRSITQYVQIPAGDNWVEIVSAQSRKSIHSQIIALREQSLITWLLFVRNRSYELLPITDPLPNRTEGGCIRFLHFAEEIPSVDVLDEQGQIYFQNIPFSKVTNHRSFPAGRRRLQIRRVGTTEILYQMRPFRYGYGQRWTLVSMGGFRSPFRLVLVRDL